MEKELSLNEIHRETLNIILKIDEICERLRIKYTAWYGSMLGAVRHNGFIPWDDDFDIAMLRPDYEIFIDYCKNNIHDLGSFRILDKSCSDDYPFNLARFCDMRYRMETPEFPDAGMGLFVDIYPLDPVGNDPEKAQKRIQWRKKLYSIGWNSTIKGKPVDSRKGVLEKIIKRLIYLWAKNKPPMYFYNKYDELAKVYDYETSDNVAVVVWEMSFRAMPKLWFNDLIKIPFETIEVYVPKQYNAILTQVYGDYLKLPPQELQVPTHAYKLYKR